MSEEQVVNVAFVIDISNSTALSRVGYNSENEVLEINFTSGSQYSYQDISISDALRMISDAVNLNSWGKAWNILSKRLDAMYKTQYNATLAPVIKDAHKIDLERMKKSIDDELERRAATGNQNLNRRMVYGR